MATLKDIATKSEVSTSTVSKILSESSELGRMSQKTINRVRRVAKELGYQPNLNARALVSKRSMVIGVYIAPYPGVQITEFFVAPLLEGISQASCENSYDLMLINFGVTDTSLQSCIDKFQTNRIDGLVVIYADPEDPALQSLLKLDMPIVATDYFDQSREITSVNLDNESGIVDVVNYLYALEHSKIAFIGELSPQHIREHNVRKEAFLRIANEKGISDSICVTEYENTKIKVVRDLSNYCFKDGYYGVDWLLKNNKQFTAVVCYNDWVAMGAMKRLNEAKISIPDQVSVVGFDNTSLSECSSPTLTTVSHPSIQMGRQAVEHILDSLRKTNGDKTSVRKIMFKPELVVRQSTSKARK